MSRTISESNTDAILLKDISYLLALHFNQQHGNIVESVKHRRSNFLLLDVLLFSSIN